MTVNSPTNSPGEFPRHFVAKLEYEGQLRYVVFETYVVIHPDYVDQTGEEVLSRYVALQQGDPLIGPVPPQDDFEFMSAVRDMETGDEDTPPPDDS